MKKSTKHLRQFCTKERVSNYKVLIVLFSLMALVTNSFAQSNVNDAYIKTSAAGSNNVICDYTVVLNDTNNVDEIEFQLGTEKTGSDLVSFIVNINTGSGLANGWSFERIKNTVTIKGGTIPNRTTYYGQVKSKINGVWESPFCFIAN